jgi:hypothetical protein
MIDDLEKTIEELPKRAPASGLVEQLAIMGDQIAFKDSQETTQVCERA